MKKITVGLVDDNKDFIYLLSELIKRQENMQVSFMAYDGDECLEHLKDNKVDVLILDMLMPKVNGLSVLEKFAPKKLNTKIIILTSAGEEETKKKAVELGADYYVLKPFDLDTLIKRITEISGNKPEALHNEDIEKRISKLIQKNGIPLHVKGYLYLKEAVSMVYDEPYVISSITKVIYPDIAKKYNTTSSCVERAIRHSIDVSWDKKDGKKPKNGEFIARLAEEIRLNDN